MDAQLTSPITLETPLGTHLTFHSMGGIEGLSRLFVYELDAVSDRSDIKPSEIVDHPITVHLALGDDDDHVHYWNGRVVRIQYLATGDDGMSRYRLTLRPWLWELTLSADCRIFQNMSIPDIVAQIFHDRGFTEFENALSETYPKREYVVQYRETDFQFISRWLEREGIYYFFRHEDGKHTLVLADSPMAHAPTPGCEQIPFAPDDKHRDTTMAYVRRWSADARFETGSYAHADYDFTAPRVTLFASGNTTDDFANTALRVYDHPGGFQSFSDAESYARLRLAQARRDAIGASGETNARGLTVGATFQLVDNPREDQNQKYLVTSARYRLSAPDVASGTDTEAELFNCTFTVNEANQTFRPPLATPASGIRGPQTATVVGPNANEIYTDQYGRVKIQFHWDRLGTSDEKSSCWVRVGQMWAGSGFGAQFVPRIGQEVIVDFLDGDPDRPIVTGSVYNANNMPPFRLPEYQTQSGIRTRSSMGGTLVNGNEIRFEDLAGQEELFLQAEKDMTVLVKNSHSANVTRDQNVSIGANEQLTVGVNRTRNVAINETVTIGAAQSVTVGGIHAVTVGAAPPGTGGLVRVVTVGANENTIIGNSHSLTVGGDLSRNVTGNVTTQTTGDHTENFGGGFIAKHVGHRVVVVGGPGGDRSASLHVEGSGRAYASTTFEVIALKGLTITCGKSQIQIATDTITITSPTITLVTKDAEIQTTKFNVAATDAVTIGGSKVTVTSSGASVALDSNATVQGAQVKLGSGSGASAQSQDKPPKVTTLQLNDQTGAPLANQTVILRFGGDGGEERTVTLDDKGSIDITGEDSFDVIFPEVQGATKA